MPAVSGIRSLRTIFQLAMICLVLILSVPLLYSGIRIMDNLVNLYGVELLVNELHAQTAQLDRQYATLKRVGLEDSLEHQQEIMRNGLQRFSGYHYKKSGELFVVTRDKTLLLAGKFKNNQDDFNRFFPLLQEGISPLHYSVNGTAQLAVVQLYPPWNSFIGISMSRSELFAPRNLFIRISLSILLLVLTAAGIFIWWIQQYFISPLIMLSRFSSQVKEGDYHFQSRGQYIFELKTLKEDILEMVASLRKKMAESREQMLRIQENEERYRAVYNAPGDAIVIHDHQSGAFLEINKGAEEMFGYSAEELQQLTIADISQGKPPYGPDETASWMRRTLNNGSAHFEWLGKKKDGTLFWLDVSLHATVFTGQRYIIAVSRDIDQKKQAEIALAREKEQLAVTLRSIGDGVITTDLHGRVVLINRVAEQLTGWTQQQAAGVPLHRVFHIVDKRNGESYGDLSEEVLKKGTIIELANHTILLSRDGRHHSIADSAAPILDPERQVIGVVVVFRDVTEKNRMEQELFKVKKLESVGVLAGGIAHDFNNILAVVLGNISLSRMLLEKGGDVMERVDTFLEKAEKASDQARTLTNQLLTFSKGGDPIKQTASIAEILQESADFILHGSPVSCSFDIAADLWSAEVDPGQISQVVQNVILNACQAMPEGGEIQVAAENCETCRGMSRNCLRLVISDNGPGMTEKILEKIFDPYFSTKPAGSGLGLAICHSILEKHEGSIQVTSREGSGTSFTILLPVSNRRKPVAVPEKTAGKEGKLKVLLMDDEPLIRDMVTTMLTLFGHQVQTVIDGREAIDCYCRAMDSNEPFDVVIMDLTIPGGMGGKEAAARLLKIDPHARLIVSSGFSTDPVVADFRQYGFSATISKPYTGDTMRRVLQEVCGCPQQEQKTADGNQ